MLNFITTKKNPKNEFRFYLDTQDYEGRVIYKGHKLGIDQSLLSQILDYRMERSTNKIYLMDYETEDNWFSGSNSNLNSILEQSYDSLQRKAEKKFGKFRKILITVV